METIIRHFKKQEIAFDLFSFDVMVNATEMAKPFGKRVQNFMRLQSTEDFINALLESQEFMEEVQYNSLTSELVKKDFTKEELKDFIVKAKEGQFHSGTFMCSELAIQFAQWLSPHFAVWVSQTIKKIVFGSNHILVRNAVMELPKLHKSKLDEEKILHDQRAKLFGLDNIDALKQADANYKETIKEINKITEMAAKPTMFDDPEDLGNQILTLAKKRDEYRETINALEDKEKQALKNEEYLNQLFKVTDLRSKIRSYTMSIKKNEYKPSDN